MRARDDFAGTWLLRRKITDRHFGQDGDFQGTAVLLPDGDRGLRYAEAGKIQLGDGPIMTATRNYIWRFGASRVDVAFGDGSAFHSFVPSGAVAGTDHPCGDDFYRVAYDFGKWPDWSATWSVTGPRKDYTSVSYYSRGA